jgi:rRNA-processing protein FCF1
MRRPTVLLDEQLFGLDEYLRDLGWTTAKVRPGITDDEVVSLARDNHYIVVSLDRKLLSRCRVMGIPSIDLGLEMQARIVHESLQKLIARNEPP